MLNGELASDAQSAIAIAEVKWEGESQVTWLINMSNKTHKHLRLC